MAGENVGTLSAIVTADTSDFTTQIAGASTTVKSFSKNVEQSSRTVATSGKGFRNAQFAIQQLAFGAEDAAAVYGTAGLSGAVRAAGNNISQFASIIHPVAGIVAGFATAGLSILINNLDKSADAAEKATEKVRDFSEALFRVDQAQRERERQFDVPDFGAGVEQLEAQRVEALKEVKKFSTEIRAEQDRIAAIGAEWGGALFGDLQEQFVLPQGPNDSPFRRTIRDAFGADMVRDIPEDVMKQIRAAEQRIHEMARDRRVAQDRAFQLRTDIEGVEGDEERQRELDREADRIKNQAEAQKRFNDMKDEALRIQREINKDLNPQAAKEAEILRQTEERVKQIRDLIPAIGQDEANRLVGEAEAASKAEIARLRDKADSKVAREQITAPAAIRDSAQALSSIARNAARGGEEATTAKNTAALVAEAKKQNSKLDKIVSAATRRNNNDVQVVVGGLP